MMWRDDEKRRASNRASAERRRRREGRPTRAELQQRRVAARAEKVRLAKLARASRLTFPQRLRQIIDEHKTSRGCQVCGLAEPAYVLDHHHVDPTTKLYSVARAKSYARLEAELAKCVVLCAIHHRMVEAGDIQLKEAT